MTNLDKKVAEIQPRKIIRFHAKRLHRTFNRRNNSFFDRQVTNVSAPKLVIGYVSICFVHQIAT